MNETSTLDLAIIGAGPIGLEAAILARRHGLNYEVFEAGAVVNAIYNYPTYMTFFTTSERLEIGGHPLITATDKPTRKEALDYYRKVTAAEQLNISLYSKVTALVQEAHGFALTVETKNGQAHGQIRSVYARKVAVATGYFDTPKLLGIPGEDRPNVSHYYSEAHAFWQRPVTIIGAGSSAADAALDLYRAGAKVTMIHRGDSFRHSLKYWIRPNLENRVKEGSITAHFNTTVQEITADTVIAHKHHQDSQTTDVLHIPSDFSFALTGYYAAPDLLRSAGVNIGENHAAELNHDTYESNVPGLYVLGSAGFGTRTSDVFIENGLVHSRQAVDDIVTKLNAEAVLEPVAS
ncbi:MAG: YpdA family putative bacillithiol disulfide reductase [Deinococcota bacterium]